MISHDARIHIVADASMQVKGTKIKDVTNYADANEGGKTRVKFYESLILLRPPQILKLEKVTNERLKWDQHASMHKLFLRLRVAHRVDGIALLPAWPKCAFLRSEIMATFNFHAIDQSFNAF
eukprot:2816502-Amphidinium_carterae.1